MLCGLIYKYHWKCKLFCSFFRTELFFIFLHPATLNVTRYEIFTLLVSGNSQGTAVNSIQRIFSCDFVLIYWTTYQKKNLFSKISILLKISHIFPGFPFGWLGFFSILPNFHHVSFGLNRIDGILPAVLILHASPCFNLTCLQHFVTAFMHICDLKRDFHFLESTSPSWPLFCVICEYLSLGENSKVHRRFH